MGRPKKSALASRANGARARNKGLPVNVTKELIGFDKEDDTAFVIKSITVRRTFAKGEMNNTPSCERFVFAYCLYHGKFVRFGDGDELFGEGKKIILPSGVDLRRWEAAEQRAELMLKQCEDQNMDVRAKMALLRKLTKKAKIRFEFGR